MSTYLPPWLERPDPEIYRTGEPLFLDFETTNIEHGSALVEDNRVVLSCWKFRGTKHYCWGGEFDQAELVKACREADFLVAHNAKFELQWLHRCGLDIGTVLVYCTFAAEWVIAGNRRWRLSLEECMNRRNLPGKLSVVSNLINAGVCPSDIPRSLLLKYCDLDVAKTEELFYAQLSEMEDTRLLPIVFTRCIVIPPLADIERNGLHLDAARVEEEYNKTLARYIEVRDKLDILTGGINPKSPPQVATFVYGELGFAEAKDRRGNFIRNKPNKQFPDGMPKTDEATLLSLNPTTDKQREFIKLKKRQGQLSAALDKNLSMFVGACREQDGIIYAELRQGRAVTHRLASSGRSVYYKMFDAEKGCQFHNLPRAYKRLFSPRNEGWLIGEADGAQLEFRVAGHIGDDDVIRRELLEGYDVHLYTQEVISAHGGKDITRTTAKAHTFKPLYGGRSGTDAEKAYYEAFGEKYSSLKDTQESWCIQVGNNKQFTTEWGMTFYYPEARVSHTGYLNVRTKVFNIPIQSFATADIIPIGLAYAWYRLRGAQTFLVNTVHDSLEAEIHPEEVQLYKDVMIQSLSHDVYSYLDKVYDVQFSVPLGVGITIGKYWGELPEGEDEIKVSIPTPFDKTGERKE
jgi:DNA polymerase I-like protein with 3'-5' exonuclease and polymerase domains